MARLFLYILNMSVSATYAVLAILLLRPLLKKAPRWISVAAWAIVGLRLVMPFSPESILSIIPSSQVVSPDIMFDEKPTVDTGIPLFNTGLNYAFDKAFSPHPGDSVNPLQILVPFISIIWAFGAVLMLTYLLISYVRVKRRVSTSVLLSGNVYESDAVSSPFVLGVFKPKIYIPCNMERRAQDFVTAHEKAHIKRRDHLWKPLGFVLLTVYWFNPLMWLAYILLCRDIEFACDEKVIKELGREDVADYSELLLSFSVNKKVISACPLAFGEVGVKKRIKSVLNYKRPAFWIIIIALIACLVFSVCLLTNPKEQMPPETYTDYEGIYVTLEGTEREYVSTLLKIKWHNKTDRKATFDKHYDIEYLDKNGEWVRVGGGTMANTLEGYVLNPYSTHDDEHSTFYNKLDKNGRYRLVADFTLSNGIGGLERYKTWVEFTAGPRSEIYNIPMDEEFYSELDASGGLDVYVGESYGGKNYRFMVFPHSFEVDYSYILGGGTVDVDEMRRIIKRYDIEEEDIYIIPYHPPLSSWMSDYFCVAPGEDFEAKQAAYRQMIRDLILE